MAADQDAGAARAGTSASFVDRSEHGAESSRPAASQVWCGDCRRLLARIPDASVDLIITSPPYANQRRHTYGGVQPERYVEWFLSIARELYRVLKPTGSFVLNIREHCHDGERHPYVLHLIQALRHQGWRWVEEYVWVKTNPLPGEWPNRLPNGWERLLHFAKAPRFAMYRTAVMIPATAKPRRLTARDQVRQFPQTGSGFSMRRSNFVGRTMKLPSNVLHLPCESSCHTHSAPFPVALPAFFIKLFTQPGDLVLDPFLGSGTTAVAAQQLSRRSIGIERRRAYVDAAMRRLANHPTTPNNTECLRRHARKGTPSRKFAGTQ